MNPFLEFLASILLWIVLLPVGLVITTPYILIVVAFRPDPYWTALWDMYGTATEFSI